MFMPVGSPGPTTPFPLTTSGSPSSSSFAKKIELISEPSSSFVLVSLISRRAGDFGHNFIGNIGPALAISVSLNDKFRSGFPCARLYQKQGRVSIYPTARLTFHQAPH